MRIKLPLLCLACVALVLSGCRTLQEIANLRSVDFALDRVTDAELAGVDLQRIRGYNDISTAEIVRIGAALSNGNLPLEFTLHLAAENPETNEVQARMVRMDWTLFLEDRETVSGVFDDTILLPPGQVADIPLFISLDLVDFFDDNLTDLVELALSVSGQGGQPKDLKIEIQPTIDTPIGPIRYPEPITIVSREVG